METGFDRANAYEAGEKAFHCGRHLYLNIYDRKTHPRCHRAWIDGWLYAAGQRNLLNKDGSKRKD